MRALRCTVFNAEEAYGPALRAAVSGFDFVRLVAEVDEPAILGHVLHQFPAEVLLVHLDPDPEGILPLVAPVVASMPHLAVLAISESTDGKLILSVMRQGFREFLTKPIDHKILGEALAKVAQQSTHGAPGGRLISLLSTVGGAGGTSLATNLSVELASMCDGRVTLVDLDYRFGQVATLLDVSPNYTIADLAANPEQLEPQMIERALIKHASGVYVLSRPTQFVQCDNITAANCVAVLSGLMSMNEYVIVDGPNRYDVGASAILDLADLTLLIVQLVVPSVRNAQRILQGMQEAGFNLERTKLVCNRVGKDAGALMLSDVEATLGKRAFFSLPDDWTTMSSAINLGEPLVTRSPKSKLRAAIRELAERIHTPTGPADDSEEKESTKKGGRLLSKIFSDA